jgi:hypothetical protein
VNKPTLTTSKSVFVPRGTATYTPKWSIVVLAVACLGVLKLNGLREKTDRDRTSTASFFPTIETTTVPKSGPPDGIAGMRRMGVDLRNEAGNEFRGGSGPERSNRLDSATMDKLKNGK